MKQSSASDLITLRKAKELIVDLPRVGFFTTPAFFATWPTNVNNLARVTTNQSLIVALGRSMNPESATIPLNESGLDEQHADPRRPATAAIKPWIRCGSSFAAT